MASVILRWCNSSEIISYRFAISFTIDATEGLKDEKRTNGIECSSNHHIVAVWNAKRVTKRMAKLETKKEKEREKLEEAGREESIVNSCVQKYLF